MTGEATSLQQAGGSAPTDVDAALAAIERDVREQRQRADALADALARLAPDIPPGHAAYTRFLTARAIVENRQGLPQTALVTLAEARQVARRAGDHRQLGAIALATAVVQSWRSDTRSAALDLIDGFAFARFANDPTILAEAMAESVRLNLEAGRYQAALGLIELVAAIPDAELPAYQRNRIEINRCQILNALERHDEALAAVARIRPGLPAEPRRLPFLLKVEEAWALYGLDRDAEAKAIVAELGGGPFADPAIFEWAEYSLLAGTLGIDADPAASATLLRKVRDRFNDEDLPRHEIDAGICLAEALHAAGHDGEAQEVMLAALRKAVDRQLPSMADRVRRHIARLVPANELTGLIRADGPDKTAERFLVVRSIGSGGFADVYRAFDLDTGEEVALKRYRLGNAAIDRDAIVESLRREVSIGEKLRMPGVARIRYLNVGVEDDLVLVEDFVEGRTLTALMEENGERPRLLSILAEVIRIVADLHRRGLVHRDLKPDNILVRDGAPVVMDFGIASLKDVIEPIPGMGSGKYMAPEVVDKGLRSPDAPLGAEDVYALGRIAEDIWAAVAPPSTERRGLLSGFRSGNDPNKDVTDLIRAMTERSPARRTRDLVAAAEVFRAAGERLKQTRPA